MRHRDIPDQDISPINFTLSAAAHAEIDNLRRFWNGQVPDEADVLVIAWGRTEPKVGEAFEHVVVTFYGRSERASIAHGIQHMDGLEIIFFVTEEGAARFAGRTVDFAPDEGFVLRD